MALPSPASPRSDTATNESNDSILSKLPDVLEVDEQTGSDGLRECSIEISSAAPSSPSDLPTLPDALDVDEEIVADGRECSIELPTSAAFMPTIPCGSFTSPVGCGGSISGGGSISTIPCGHVQSFDDATNAFLEPERSIGEADLSALSIDSSKYDQVQQNSSEADDREKARKFPVILTEEQFDSGSGSGKYLDEGHEDALGSLGFGRELVNGKDSTSGREVDGWRASFQSSAMQRSNDDANGMKEASAQGLLESKMAGLGDAKGALRAGDDDTKNLKERKRRTKGFGDLQDWSDRTPEEKIRHLHDKDRLEQRTCQSRLGWQCKACRKFSEFHHLSLRWRPNEYVRSQVAETNRIEKECLGLTRKCKQVNKEKETLHLELAKSTTVRQKLEALCRELQRQNKIYADDSKRVASEEERKRLELSTKFHDTIQDITTKLEAQGQERMRQLEENDLMRDKLKQFTQQFDIREQQFTHQLRTKTLEQQLLEVKLKQQEDKNRMSADQIAQLLKTEEALRSQLAIYGDKFEQFQETLTKSNDVFGTFKTELDKMSKTVKKFEKENASLKKKCEKSDVSIIELLEERDLLKKQLNTTKIQKDKLEALCRSLQAERKLQSVAFDSANSLLPSQLEHLKLSSPE